MIEYKTIVLIVVTLLNFTSLIRVNLIRKINVF